MLICVYSSDPFDSQYSGLTGGWKIYNVFFFNGHVFMWLFRDPSIL